MKKFNFAKIVSLVFVCAMLLCALAVTALAQDETTVEIVSNNVYFGEKYQLMYAVNAPAGAEVSATVNGKAVDVDLYETEPKDLDGKVVADYSYIVTEGVAAQAIDTVVTFTVEADGKTATSNYSVLQYVYERMYVKNIAEGKELAMFEAFLAFADAANANFTEGEAVSFNDYKCVTVVNGTIDGTNNSGLYSINSTPFANISADFEPVDGKKIQWYVSKDGASEILYDLEDLKALVVDGHIVVRAEEVEGDVVIPQWTLLTDASMLADGKTIVIVSTESNYALGTTQNSNNRKAVSVVKNDNTVSIGDDVQIITLEAGTVDGTFAFNVGNGYLYAASSGNNYLKTQTTNDANGSWKIEITSAGVATIKAQGTNSRNLLKKNSSSELFSCYGSGQHDVSIYMLSTDMVVCEHVNTETHEGIAATCTEAGKEAGTFCTDCGKYTEGGKVVEALGHDWEDADCTNPKTCQRENCGLTEGEPVGHTWGDWTEDQAPTCKDAGTKTRGCTKCNATEEGVINATGEHNDGNSDGLCDVCKADVNSDEEKAKQALADITPPKDVTVTGNQELDRKDDTGYGATISWEITGGTNKSSIIENNGDTLYAVLENGKTTIKLTVTVKVGEEIVTNEYIINVEAIPVEVEPITNTYTFSNYTAGTQYAENEKHVLDDYITVTTTQAHFTTELRLYSSSAHDGFAIVTSTKTITGFSFNAGNKADTVNVYGSNDGGITWTLIQGVSVSSSYKDYTVTISEGTSYTMLKLDVAGTQQVRIKSMTITMK